MTPCRFYKPSLKDEVKRLRHNAVPKERELKDKKIKCEKCNYEPELRNLLPIINQQSRCPECGETIYLCVGKSGKYDYKNERTIVERLLDVTTSEQRRKLREDIVRRIKEGDMASNKNQILQFWYEIFDINLHQKVGPQCPDFGCYSTF